MRILMLTHTYPPALGGIERYVRMLSTELTQRGHEISVATLWNEGLAEFELDQGVRVHRLRGTVHRASRLLFTQADRSYSPPFPDPEITWKLGQLIKQEQPQIVNAHNWMVHSFLPIKPMSGAKLVVTLHDYGLLCVKWNLLHQNKPCSGPELKKCLSCAADYYGGAKGIPSVLANRVMGFTEKLLVDKFLPVSQAVADGTGVAKSGRPYEVIPSFLPNDVAQLAEAEPDPRLSQLPKEDYLLFVGALGTLKGVDVLLKAYELLKDAPPLVMIGYDTGNNPIKENELPPNVTVLKNWPHQAVMQAWKRSLIGLVPSIWADPCPGVAQEAMALGRPVIASRMGGLPDLIEHGKTGLLVPPSDPAALAAAISQLLNDPELRASMGRAAKQRFELYKSTTVVSKIEQLYQGLLEPTLVQAG